MTTLQKNSDTNSLIYVSPSTVPSLTANAVHVLLQANALKNQYGSISLFCRRKAWTGDLNAIISNKYGVDFELNQISSLYYPFNRSSTIAIAVYAVLALLFKSKNFSVISRNLYFSFIWTVLLRRAAVYETHQVESKFGALMQKAVLNNKRTHTIVISDKLKLILEAVYSTNLTNCSVLHDAANDLASKAKNKISKICNFVNNYKLKNNFVEVAGYFGHLYTGRGIDVILDLAARNSEILFVICGGNPDQVDNLKRDCVRSNVLILGHQDYLDARQLMASCDILLMPYQKSVSIGPVGSDTSRWMSPMKMFEYMETGKPIISSNLDVLREILIDSENALLVAPDNLEEWHAALKLLKNNSELAVKIGENARSQLLTEYTWSIRAKKIIHILERL